MKVEETEIKANDHDTPRFCGACHNGQRAFSTKERCDDCHNGNIASNGNSFGPTFSRIPYRYTPYGNNVDWVSLIRNGQISPAKFLEQESGDIPFDRELVLDAEWCRIPPAVFPHAAHTDWLECNSCHPDIFNIKKKTTKHFRMTRILKGEFCGTCHLKVAFPMHDCQRCHPEIQNRSLPR